MALQRAATESFQASPKASSPTTSSANQVKLVVGDVLGRVGGLAGEQLEVATQQ
jgi:hypothetical protein